MWHPERLYDTHGHLDEGVIHAWLDGALDRDAAREVEAHAAGCATCSGRVGEARGLVAGASRILAALDAGAAVAPPGAAASGRAAGTALHPRARWGTRRLSLAAAAVFLLVAGSVVLRDQLGDAGVREAIVGQPEAAPVAAPGSAAPSSAAPGGARGVVGEAVVSELANPRVASRAPAAGLPELARSAEATEVPAARSPRRTAMPLRTEAADAGSLPRPAASGGSAAGAVAATRSPRSAPAAGARSSRSAPAPNAAPAQTQGLPELATVLAEPAPNAAPAQKHGLPEPATTPAAPGARAADLSKVAPGSSKVVGREPLSATLDGARASAPAVRGMMQKQAVSAAKVPTCWHIADSTSMLILEPSSAPDRDGWQLGERLTEGTRASVRWRQETGYAGQLLRVLQGGGPADAGLLLRIVGDSLFEMPTEPGESAGSLRGVRVRCP